MRHQWQVWVGHRLQDVLDPLGDLHGRRRYSHLPWPPVVAQVQEWCSAAIVSTMSESDAGHVPPNHHAHHPGFSGWGGFVAAIRFLFKRHETARLAIDLACVEGGDRVVDIGCGPGYAADLARRRGCRVIGIDPAPIMLRVARLRWWGRPRPEWSTGTAESLPVDDAWATVAWSIATVHHWHDLEVGLSETRRVLRPGGRFVALERRVENPLADGVDGHGWCDQQAEDFAAACRDAGFERVEVGVHDAPGPVLSVTAHLPDDSSTSTP